MEPWLAIPLTLACSLFGFGGASAYIGESFVTIPGIVGGASGKSYDDWLKIEAHYWRSADVSGQAHSSGLATPSPPIVSHQ